MAGDSWSAEVDSLREPTGAETRLLKVLAGLSDSVAFCVHGEVDSVLPGLTINSVGEVGVPVSAADARRIIKASCQAPYGKGEETIVDTEVRRVWQLEPDQFEFENEQWDGLVDTILKRLRTGFGLKRKIHAELYKLLVYEKGSFFLPHRDTEKVEGMFATLIVCLPSRHTGGKLIVSHGGQRIEADFAPQSKFATQFASFYADCEHEVKPVKSGYRICVVYNLSIARTKKQPLAPEFGAAVESAAATLPELFDENDERELLVLPLLHQYTEAGLSGEAEQAVAGETLEDDDGEDETQDEEPDQKQRINLLLRRGYRNDDPPNEADLAENTLRQVRELLKQSKKATRRKERDPQANRTAGDSDSRANSQPDSLQLKGADRGRVEVLKQAAEKSGFRAYIARLTHWQSGHPDYGTIEHDYGYGRYGQAYDINDGNQGAEFEEVFDESMKLTHWHDLSGRRQSFVELHIDESDVLSDLDPEDRPHRQQLHEATGNAGVSMERWYHQAVIVLWPISRHFEVLASQGPANAVPDLANILAEDSQRTGVDDCKTFARAIMDKWVSTNRYQRHRSSPVANRFLQSLVDIGDSGLALQFFKQLLPIEYAAVKGSQLIQLARLAGWKKITPLLTTLFNSQKPRDYDADLAGLVGLFHSLCCDDGGKLTPDRKATCVALVDPVEKAIARWDKTRRSSWHGEAGERSAIVEPVLKSFCAVGSRTAIGRFLEKITSGEKRYDLHQVLIPAVAELISDETFSGEKASALSRSTVKKLRKHCIDELRRRTESEPQPPADWKRSAKLGCSCDDCKELARFLRSRTKQVLRLPRRQELRQHLHQRIDRNRIDCTHVTEREGRPYTLVCTKTRSSYDRNLRQYKTNLKLLAELEK